MKNRRRMGNEDYPWLRGKVVADGDRSGIAESNNGVIQTGDNSRVEERHVHLSLPVSLGSPSLVSAPKGSATNLPRPPASVFVGRDEPLQDLAWMVEAGSGVVAQAVHGLGGVGKSELALQYAATRADMYTVIWWVAADTPDSIEAGLAALAQRLHPDAMVVASSSQAAEWAIGWLQTHLSWLLILDNVEQTTDVEGLLGQLSTGHVLITSRRDIGWEQITRGCLRLGALSPDAAVELLIRRTGQQDVDGARALAAELGFLPLALQQAAALIIQTKTSVAGYLHRLRKKTTKVLAKSADGTSAEQAVARVWSVTLATIADRCPLAVSVLGLAACYGADDLPRDVLSRYRDDSGEVDEALGVLASYNMVTLTSTTVSVHRLVQAVLVAELRSSSSEPTSHQCVAGYRPGGIGTWESVREAALRLLCDSLPKGDPATRLDVWPRWKELAPHVDAVVAHFPTYSVDASLGWVLGTTASFLGTQGQYRQALEYEWRALAISEGTLGPEHREVATRLNNLAVSLRALGRVEEAEPLQRRALAISEAVLGPEHPMVATCLDNLALTLRDLGRVDEAEPLQRRGLVVSEQAYGLSHPVIATRLDNLAVSLWDLGRGVEAESLQRRALAISEAAFGPQHPAVATGLNNLAASMAELGRADEAEPLQRRALAISEAALGPEHPTVATRLDNLALSLRDLGRPAEAETLQRRALAISEAALGAEHTDVAIRLDNLAVSVWDLGRPAEAESLQRRAVAISVSTLGPEHPDVATRLDNLAASLWALGRHEQAKSLQRRASAIRARRIR